MKDVMIFVFVVIPFAAVMLTATGCIIYSMIKFIKQNNQ